jgi:hypothetical protein
LEDGMWSKGNFAFNLSRIGIILFIQPYYLILMK